jgi:CDP-glycerol glycerophosphotransferase (TagB/SpsB family)
MPKTIFLQHGVTALKNSMEAYHVSKRRFDRFVVCSEREADDVAKACEYPRERMLVSGFPRYDSLLQLVKEGGGGFENIVIFPTWRRGLDKKTHEEFLQSEFYASWYAALEKLRQVADRVGARLQLVSHPIIERHVHAFAALVDEVVEVERIQHIIVNAGCLITDYSSIAFDALYAGRRCFFYTFDAEEFGFREGAFVDVDTQLPGTRVATAEELAEAVLREWPLRHSLDPRTVELAPLYFAHFDSDNSNRIEREIEILAGKIDPIVVAATGDTAIEEGAGQSSEGDVESRTASVEGVAEDQAELQDDELDDRARSDGTLEDDKAEEE